MHCMIEPPESTMQTHLAGVATCRKASGARVISTGSCDELSVLPITLWIYVALALVQECSPQQSSVRVANLCLIRAVGYCLRLGHTFPPSASLTGLLTLTNGNRKLKQPSSGRCICLCCFDSSALCSWLYPLRYHRQENQIQDFGQK